MELLTLITNQRKAIENGAFVTTEMVVIASALKNENFKRALSHFSSQHSMIQAFYNTNKKLTDMATALEIEDLCLEYSDFEKEMQKSGNPIATDRDVKNAVAAFVPDFDTVSVLTLQKCVADSFKNHMLSLK